jgi:hypothetical protein
MNTLDTEEGAGVQPFRKLGELVLGDVCPWVSRELAANMLTPLMKHATGNDARPVSAKDCDYAVWIKSIQRTVVKSVTQNVLPQQLGIGVSNGGEAKHVMLRMCQEERLATGRGGVVVKDDRINAHNTFNNKQQVLAARAMTGAALFARMSDTLARTQAEIFTTSTNALGAHNLTTRGAGGEQGNSFTPLLYAGCISRALQKLEEDFPEVLVRAIHDDTTLLGDAEMIFREGGARQQLATDLANVGSELHEGKAEAYGMTPEDRVRFRRVSSNLQKPGRTQ